MFGPESTCKNLIGVDRLILTGTHRPCLEPCKVLWTDNRMTAELSPYPWLTVPFILTTDGWSALFGGFHTGGPEGAPMWTSEHASIWFLTADKQPAPQQLRITVDGETLAGRPAEVELNGHPLGSIASGQPHSRVFMIPSDLLKSNSENNFSFSVPAARPVGQDVRHLGFLLERVEVAAAP